MPVAKAGTFTELSSKQPMNLQDKVVVQMGTIGELLQVLLLTMLLTCWSSAHIADTWISHIPQPLLPVLLRYIGPTVTPCTWSMGVVLGLTGWPVMYHSGTNLVYCMTAIAF